MICDAGKIDGLSPCPCLFAMSATLDPRNSNAADLHHRRYLTALQDPGDDPLAWLISEPRAEFNADEVLSSVQANRLTVSQCLACLQAAIHVADDAADPTLARLTTIIAACENASPSYLNEQLMLVELPIVLLQKFEGGDHFQRLGDSATELLAQRVEEVLDDDGWPGPKVTDDYGPLVASWTRSVALLESVGWTLDEEAMKSLRWLPRQMMRLKRADKSLMMSESNLEVADDLIKLMISVFGDGDDLKIFKRTVDEPESPRPNLVMLDKTCNTISTWGGSLLFHDRWEKKACRIAAEFNIDGCQLEIGKAKSLICGDAFPELIVDGNPLSAIDQPDVLVEYLDGRVAFAEIQWHFDHEVVMQRQIILSMEDKFAWIGDAVSAPDKAVIEYACKWPLGKGVSTVQETETNETYLFDGKKMRGLIIPPALHEWKAGRSEGQLVCHEDHFLMQVKRDAKTMYVPLFIDLSPKRSLKPRTWRQLTVAENLEIVDSEVAVAYRVQVGKQQFAFYRSMAEAANRTFFGENVNTEMFLGRLEKNKSMTELVQIE